MKNRVGNNFKIKNETGVLGEKSMDAAIGVLEGNDSVTELEELQRQFNMQLADYEPDVREEVAEILINLLEYPSAQQAQQHQEANRLGVYDLKLPKGEQEQSWQELRQGDSKILCRDCGLVVQPSSIPLCTSFTHFPKMGIAAYLYFQNIKNLIVLLILLAGFYCSYALYVNISEPSSSFSSNAIKKISFASTIQNLTTNTSLYDSMLKEGWLVAGGVLLWWLALFIMKRMAIKQQRMVDDETITAADFSIMLEHLPVTTTKESLQRDLDNYYTDIKEHKEMHGKDELRPFKIRKFCKATPFYFLDDQSIKERIEEIDAKISDKREVIADLVYEEVIKTRKFITKSEDRKALYAQFRDLLEQRKKQEEELKLLSKNFEFQQNKEITTAAFVVFQVSESANAIEACNPRGFGAVLRYYLSCCKSGIYFLEDKGVVTSRAPEPEDIIWQNIGIPENQIVKRKLLTYFVTFLILCASFGIVYGFTILQMTYKNAILSIAISLSITIINIVIGIAIRRLTIYQSDITSTNRQTGLALKSIFAQLINSTIVPVITNIYIKKNTYEAEGLIYDIFFLSITNTLLPPILKLVDIPYRIKQFTINFMLDDPNEKLPLSQKDLNKIYEFPEYQLGVAYIYFIDTFYFTCFYVFVHPFVVVFALIGFFLMYWAQKNAILTRSRRPAPGSAVLNEMMGQLVGFAPCVLSVGQLIWFNIIREDYHNFSDGTSVSHWASLGFSLLFFLLPFNAIFNAYCAIPDDEDLIYQQVRSQLTSEYDLLNPVTADQALQEFIVANNKEQKRQASGRQQAAKPAPTPPQTQAIKVNGSKPDELQFVADMQEANNDGVSSSRPKKDRKRVQSTKNKILEGNGTGGYGSSGSKKKEDENNPYDAVQF